MDVVSAFVASGESAAPVEPSKGALDDPAVLAEPLPAVDAAAGDARRDVAAPAGAPATALVARLVGVQLVGPLPWPARLAADRRHGIEQRFERRAVVNIGAGQQEGERNAAPVGDEVALGAGTAAIDRVRSGGFAPLFAATLALSRQARLQSIRSAWCSRRSSTRCRRSHTPAACQSRNRRQQVTPAPQPISCGSISQGMPDDRTNKMPVRAARFGSRGRPPFGFGGSSGSNGSTINHNSSDTRRRDMTRRLVLTYFASRF